LNKVWKARLTILKGAPTRCSLGVSYPNAIPLQTRDIPLEFLQRNFDVLFNKRERPLFKVRLHGEEYGSSTLTVLMEHPVKGWEMLGEPKDLGKLEIPIDTSVDAGPVHIPDLTPDPDFRFNDFNSDRITLNVTPEGIEVRVSFETNGEEIKINNFPTNLDITRFSVTLKFRFKVAMRLMGLAIDKPSIIPDVALATDLWDVTERIKNGIKDKVYEELQKRLPEINQQLTRWLLGGDYYV
jgi:hypothetical protein